MGVGIAGQRMFHEENGALKEVDLLSMILKVIEKEVCPSRGNSRKMHGTVMLGIRNPT